MIPGIYAPRIPRLAHPAGDVGLSAVVARVLEDGLGPVVLNEHARAGIALLVAEHGVEGGAVAYPRGLLRVVRDDDDGVLRLDLMGEGLDGGRRDRVERRARALGVQNVERP